MSRRTIRATVEVTVENDFTAEQLADAIRDHVFLVVREETDADPIVMEVAAQREPVMDSAGVLDVSGAPWALRESLAEWQEENPEDLVTLPADSQDALILSSNADAVTWIDPEGRVRRADVRWLTISERPEPLEDSDENANKDKWGVRTTAELEGILDDAMESKESGSWGPIAESCNVSWVYLTDYIATDELFHLVFNNGHVERIGHPEDGPWANDGDMWDVSELGWA